MSRARVALVIPVFPARSETFIVANAVEMAAAGWDVHIVCQRRDDALLAELPGRARSLLRGRVHRAWPHRPRWRAALLAPFALLRCFLFRPSVTMRYLRRGGTLRRLYLDAEFIRLAPAIVHFEFGALAVGRMDLGPKLDAATVVSFRGYDLSFVGLEDPAHYADVWRRASAVHVLGAYLWQRAQARGCPPDKPHALIPPAVDAAYFDPGARAHSAPAGSLARPLRILSVGRLDWRKGYEYALEAVRALEDRGVRCEYRIIGTGDFHTATAFARYQLGLVEVVTLLGAKPPADVREEMRWADVFLHAAVSEGFGNSVMEAQAMMLPVVCTRAGGLPENVIDGETGITVPSRDPGALADALARFASGPALRARMGTAGRARVIRAFRPSDQAAAFGALYERVLDGAKRP